MYLSNLQKEIVGKEILDNTPIFEEIHRVKNKNEFPLFQLNSKYCTMEEIRACLEKVTGKKIPSSVVIHLPFYSDFGRHIVFGNNIFININVTFVDLGGITIEDNVLIGPSSRLITVNHIVDPQKRRGVIAQPILIKRNAWLGANVTVLAGVTIGENSIVAADSTVTKDVPDNVIVMGSPAKVVKTITDKGTK